MNRASRRRLKGNTTPLEIETRQHKIFKKLKPITIGILVLFLFVFIGTFIFYSQFYHNELGKVKLIGSDKSEMYVEEDGTFKWYRAKWGKDEVITENNDYVAGILRFYTGKEALTMLDKYSEHFWGLTSKDAVTMFDEEYNQANMFIMTITGVYYKENQEDNIGKDNAEYVKYYLGFRQDNILDIMKAENNGLFTFTIVED